MQSLRELAGAQPHCGAAAAIWGRTGVLYGARIPRGWCGYVCVCVCECVLSGDRDYGSSRSSRSSRSSSRSSSGGGAVNGDSATLRLCGCVIDQRDRCVASWERRCARALARTGWGCSGRPSATAGEGLVGPWGPGGLLGTLAVQRSAVRPVQRGAVLVRPAPASSGRGRGWMGAASDERASPQCPMPGKGKGQDGRPLVTCPPVSRYPNDTSWGAHSTARQISRPPRMATVVLIPTSDCA